MIYFDHAATGLPKSEGVINAVENGMRFFGNPGRGIYNLAAAGDRAIFECRKALAEKFNTLPQNCILTKNTTEALNIAIKGFINGRKEKTNVLFSNYDHNAVVRIFYSDTIKRKINIYTFESHLFDDNKTLESFKKALGHKPDLVVLTHASNVCGRIFPLERMVAEAKNTGATVITDIAQTAGSIDISAGAHGDILCMPGHKGFYGPAGTGAMIVSKDFSVPLTPLSDGGTGILSAYKEMPDILPERFEAGSINAPCFAGLEKAVKEEKHKDKKLAKKIYTYLLSELRNIKGVTVIGAPEKGMEHLWMPIILINLWGFHCEEVAEYLAEKNIAVRSGLHCSPNAHKSLGTIKTGGVRISIGRGNTFADADKLLDAVARKVTC